ncbi:cytochrome P450 [Kitasatospora sp. MBT66]|uniref:cytochrome P450 n=1 Tax=Kitasatospora sp. MBT66 TaxID=1444769 RepID=UPI0007C70C1B|nr:cytochrome P450 [Kitasatospora sp. MBT66]
MSSSARDTAPPAYVHASLPGAVPLLGHLPALVRDPAALLAGLHRHGDLVDLRLGPNRLVVPCHPELLRQVYADDRTFDKGGPIYGRFREILGNGVATCAHADHRRQRRMLQPEFRPDRIAEYAEVMTREAALLADSWRPGEVVDVFPSCYRFTLRVVTRTLLGTEVPDALAGRLQRAFETAFAGALRRVVRLPAGPRYRAAVRTLRSTVAELVRDHRAHGGDRTGLLAGLVAARDEDGTALSDAELHDQVVAMLLAGTETTASQLSWTLRLLTAHPDVLAALYRELDEVLPDGWPARWDDLPRLPYTDRVLTEALRLYPPGWVLLRTCTRDTELGGRTLPRGTQVVLSPYVAHHHSGIFADPARFDPDRWLPERAAALPRWAFAGFANGPRQCLGADFARTEAGVALATLLARRRPVALSGGRRSDDRPMRLTTVLRPHRLRLRVLDRRPPGSPSRPGGGPLPVAD